mgnify:CR=1 FL=1
MHATPATTLTFTDLSTLDAVARAAECKLAERMAKLTVDSITMDITEFESLVGVLARLTAVRKAIITLAETIPPAPVDSTDDSTLADSSGHQLVSLLLDREQNGNPADADLPLLADLLGKMNQPEPKPRPATKPVVGPGVHDLPSPRSLSTIRATPRAARPFATLAIACRTLHRHRPPRPTRQTSTSITPRQIKTTSPPNPNLDPPPNLPLVRSSNLSLTPRNPPGST